MSENLYLWYVVKHKGEKQETKISEVEHMGPEMWWDVHRVVPRGQEVLPGGEMSNGSGKVSMRTDMYSFT